MSVGHNAASAGPVIRVVAVTQSDPFFTGRFFESFLAELTHPVELVEIVLLPNFNESRVALALRLLRLYGPVGFARLLGRGDVTVEPAIALGSWAGFGLVGGTMSWRHSTRPQVDPVLDALVTHGVSATAVHSHLIGESPTLYFIHFWADGSPRDVLGGLRAAIDAARRP